MRNRWIPAAALFASILVACAGDPSDVTARDLYGLWGAVSLVYTSQADESRAVDLVGTEGATYSIQLRSDGTYESQLSGHSVPTVAQSGTFHVEDRLLRLNPTVGQERRLTIDFNGSLLTLREAQTEWDFEGDGTMEPASLRMVLDRF